MSNWNLPPGVSVMDEHINPTEENSMYVYIESENWTDEHGQRHHLYTVGFYKPGGKFEGESDHESRESAAERVNYLNGGAS